MDKLLLKKLALQSLILMIGVISFSFALKQNQAVTATAKNLQINKIENITNSANDKVMQLINTQKDNPIIDFTELQEQSKGINNNISDNIGDNYLIIIKPEGEQIALSIEDIYIKKSIQLTISGLAFEELSKDVLQRVRNDEIFIGEPKYTEVKSQHVDEESGKEEEIVLKDYGADPCHGLNITTFQDTVTKLYTAKLMIELDSVYAYNIYEDADNYYIELRKPSEVYDKILVIDAGHGGKDAGALSRGENYYEKNINLGILLELKKLLEGENIKVYYTRTDDNTVFLRPRVELGNAVDCDYFVSIHCNASEVSYPNGSEILYYNNEFKGVKAFDLAKLFSDEFKNDIGLKNRGVVEKHPEDIFIMDKAKIPMILIEVGYLTNDNDMNYLSKQENRKEIAKAIYNGIIRAYNELPVKK